MTDRHVHRGASLHRNQDNTKIRTRGNFSNVKYEIFVCNLWSASQKRFVCLLFNNIQPGRRYCLFKKSWPLLYSQLLYKLGQDFMDKNFLVLRVLGLKKALKFDLIQKCQNKNLPFWIFSKKIPQKWTPHTLLTQFWYATL